jgi:hypothetical protein
MCGYCDPVNLPLWLESRYTLMTGEWLGKWRVFALEVSGDEKPTPGEYRNHQQKLTEGVGKPVILVIDKIPAYARDRLVEMGIPFICPYAQAFIPEVMIDLQEKYPRTRVSGDQFSPTAQQALIHHLLLGPLDEVSGKEMAEILSCSPMMAGNVRDEFVQAKLGETEKQGRKVLFRFKQQGPALWEAAQSYFRSPVKKICHVVELKSPLPTLRAGLSALSDLTMINDDALSTFAASDTLFKDAIENGGLREIQDPDQAALKLEVWRYDPTKLTRTQTVDPLSLWLSLREDPDERVQGELEELMEKVEWR